MCRVWVAGAVMAAVILSGNAAAAPVLLGGTSQVCRDTLSVANTAFYSSSFYINDAVTMPAHSAVEIVAQKARGDISGGRGLVADPAVFKTIPADGRARRELYWEIAPAGATRWVMDDAGFSWRGDWYRLYGVDSQVAEGAFASSDDGKTPGLVIDQQFLPAMMLRHKGAKALWAVNTGYIFAALDDWTVYAAGKDGVMARCTIRFARQVKHASSLLPPEVRTLARLLDSTLGDGLGEGTLQPTAWIRNYVDAGWANTAVRPWAVSRNPYNRRRDVDAGLKRWSRGSASYKALYGQIQAQYPVAEAALTAFYVARFGKTEAEAKVMAARNLDLVYRMHFVFPQDYIHPHPEGSV